MQREGLLAAILLVALVVAVPATMEPAGSLVLAPFHLMIAVMLYATRGRAWKGLLLALLVGGVAGVIFNYMTHEPERRKLLASFVLFGEMASLLGTAWATRRLGRRRLANTILGITVSLVGLALFLAVASSRDPAAPVGEVDRGTNGPSGRGPAEP